MDSGPNMELRDQILEDLSHLYAQDKISVEDYERRVSAVVSAPSDADAKMVNFDILAPGRYESPTSRGHSTSSVPERPGSTRDVVAIFSGTTLKGWFKAPELINAAAIFGGAEIDLRDAEIPESGITIEVAAIFGGVDIFLPDWVHVDIEGVPIFGDISRPRESGDPRGPLIKIRGSAIFGGIDIKFKQKR